MSDIKSEFDTELDKLEFTTMKIGYGHAVSDLNKILQDSIPEAKTSEELTLILKIQKAIYQMEEVRFPKMKN